jgi:uncharacterized protein
MKVLILFSERDNINETLNSLQKKFEKIEFTLIRITNHYTENTGLFEKLSECEMCFLFLSENTVNSHIFLFASGYCTGAGKLVYIYLLNKNLQIPVFLKSLNMGTDLETSVTFIHEKYSFWKKTEIIENAKRELRKMDIMINSEDMANITKEGNIKALELFLEAGFSPNTKNKKGISLLCLAIRSGHRMLIPLLLKSGAGVNLASDDTGNTPLMDAAAAGNHEIVSDLINAGSELDRVSKIGQTSLMLAVSKGNSEITDLLIRAGADVNIKDNLGMTAKQYAELFKKTEIISQIERITS